MTRELREVWATYRGDGSVYEISMRDPHLHPEHDIGWTAKRLPLLTDADAAVLETGEAWLAAADALMASVTPDGAAPMQLLAQENAAMIAHREAVRARRAANAGGET